MDAKKAKPFMTALPKEIILSHTNISTFSVIELLKHTQSGVLAEEDLQEIYPLALELNSGVFTKRTMADFPKVAVSQLGDHLSTSCSCEHHLQKLCVHQAEVIHAILEMRNLRVFFDQPLRYQMLQASAREYGLETEPNLDVYFEFKYQEGKLQIENRLKGLLKVDTQVLQKNLAPQQPSIFKKMAAQANKKRQILVIGKHRFYNQLNFLLMEAAITQSGKIKAPVNEVAPMNLVWKATVPAEIKFYTALLSFQNKFLEEDAEAELEALKLLVENPLDLEVYYHDRSLSESISPKSLLPVELTLLKAELQLTVFKKEPFYEITAELLFNDIALPLGKVALRNEYFVHYRQALHLVQHPDLLRVIKFFKANNEILIIHSSKYEEFVRTILAPLEQLVHINYSYIRQATAAQLAEKEFLRERIIYLHQEGSFIALTPVMKYGSVEVPVYSKKQLFDTDQNGNEFKVARDSEDETRFTAIVMDQHPDFAEQIEGPEYFYLHKDRFLDEDWFLNTFEIWRNHGISILGFNEIKNNQLNPHSAKISIEVISGIDWFNAELKVGFGKKAASLKQIHRAIRNKSKFVQLDDGTKGILPLEWMDRIARFFKAGDIEDELIKIPKINFTEVADLFEKAELSAEVQNEIKNYTAQFSSAGNIPVVAVPSTLKAQLRDYQKEGLNWLNFLDDYNFGGCLADDMGLGKTLQIIAFILSQREKHGHRTNLIVVPTSLLFNWQEELAKFAPSIKVWMHYGADRKKSSEEMQAHEVVLTTYGMLLSDIRFLKDFHFNYVFLDESQAIKNPNSERYKAARLLQSRNRVVLTGTPIENNTFDLYGQLSFACPGLLGSKQYFKDIYAIPIDRFEYSKRAFELQRKIKPFVLRRTKKQVAKELPEKTEMTIYCEMNAEQRRIYDTYERELREFISATNDDQMLKSSMHVLTGLTKLRQICNSPVLLKQGHSGANAVKIEVLTEQIENKSKAHKILVFSQFVGMLDLVKTELENRNISFEYLTGQTKDRGSKVHHFQTNDEVRVFLISLKAGGVGLNLTEADYVYLIDPWWNPAAENQAIDRVYRIGQDKHVVAVRLICANTVEEKIMKLQNKKKQLAQDVIRTDAAFFQSLSKDELVDMLGQ